MSQNGKGDSPRPLSVKRPEYEKNWARAFGKRQTMDWMKHIDTQIARLPQPLQAKLREHWGNRLVVGNLDEPDAEGWCSWDGRELRFNPSLSGRDDVLAAVVQHELCHVLTKVSGGLMRRYRAMTHTEQEVAVYLMMRSFGFDPNIIDHGFTPDDYAKFVARYPKIITSGPAETFQG